MIERSSHHIVVRLAKITERVAVRLCVGSVASQSLAERTLSWHSAATYALLALLLIATPILTSCSEHESSESTLLDNSTMVSLSLRTMSITSTYEGYEAGTEWENYIDISGRNYRIYFFTYDPTDVDNETTNNKYIATFYPSSFLDNGSNYSSYTIIGEVDKNIPNYENFKVVVLANWGTYMDDNSLTPGVTTIDDICESTESAYATFSATSGFIPDAQSHIPFYGVQEYMGVEWEAEAITYLNEAITLLRAMARVEVIVGDIDESIDEDFTFDEVSLVNCNESGYCAPKGVYLKEQYDHDGEWSQDFVNGVHLVGGSNSTSQLTLPFTKSLTDEGREMWVIYIPEHDNLGADYSYVDVVWFNAHYHIHFANYSNGKTTYDANGDPDDRYDIYRNYLYRFYISVGDMEGGIKISVKDWENVFDNEWTFDVNA